MSPRLINPAANCLLDSTAYHTGVFDKNKGLVSSCIPTIGFPSSPFHLEPYFNLAFIEGRNYFRCPPTPLPVLLLERKFFEITGVIMLKC
ncbi:hypothetical protein SOVF_059570 [Spinacia oleracea]|nr:hypothetical protein SOVF_059570 [Spinacia oleracea]